MSLYGTMRTSVSGMNSMSNKLSTVSDNIANSNTTGYKRASTEFSTLLMQSGSGSYNSGGVETHVRYAITDQGSLNFTTSATDLAIQGNGFFAVQDASGANFLTRAGSFVPDSQGNLVNAGGFYLLGVTPGAALPANSFTGLQIVNVSQKSIQASPSTTGTVNGNFDSNAAFLGGVASSTNYTSKTSVVTYDNLGNAVPLDVYIARDTAANPYQWDIEVYDRATPPNLLTAPSPNTFTFDPTTGKLDSTIPSPTSLSFTVPNGSAFTLDLKSITEVASGFSFQANVDGNAPANIQEVQIDSKGGVYEVLSNGTKIHTYDIPLGNVISPNNLHPEVGNVYSVGMESGNVNFGYVGQLGLGTVKSEALEQSNVDLGSELTEMIVAQRNFTADSKVFQTGSDLLDVVVNLKR